MLVWLLVIGLVLLLSFVGLVYYDQYKSRHRAPQPDDAGAALLDAPPRGERA
ncbi:MAG: hypothetical protein ACE5R4_14635 [Armatimonadota bacterium]